MKSLTHFPTQSTPLQHDKIYYEKCLHYSIHALLTDKSESGKAIPTHPIVNKTTLQKVGKNGSE